MQYKRMPIEIESPEQMGYDKIKYNLSESSYTDARLAGIDGLTLDGLKELVLCYGDHRGHEGLRHLISSEAGPISPNQVLLTIGAAGALFIIATSLLEPGDEIIVIRPNYATNIETPKAIGAQIKYVDLLFEDKYQLDPDQVRNLISPQTRYISVTYPHNPSGACLSDAAMRELVHIAETNGCLLLVDETYRDMVFGQKLPLAATYSPRVISVSSLSKSYGLPGIRTGWIVCRDEALMNTFLAAKEQIHICGSILDEEVAFRYFSHRARYSETIRLDILEKFNVLKQWTAGQQGFEWVEPQGGCVSLVRIKEPEKTDLNKFYELLLQDYDTYVGAGHWFDLPRHYMRIGFGWPSVSELRQGLVGLEKALAQARG